MRLLWQTSIDVESIKAIPVISPFLLRRNEKARFYRMARRSGTESAAILELGKCLTLINESNYEKSRELLIRIISRLTKMTRLGNGNVNGNGNELAAS